MNIAFYRSDRKSFNRSIRRIGALTLAIVLSASSAVAQQNDSCTLLESELQSNNREKMLLLKQYPGTVIGLGICLKVADEEYKRSNDEGKATTAFSICAAGVCFFSSLGNCRDVAVGWFSLMFQKNTIETRMRELSCPK